MVVGTLFSLTEPLDEGPHVDAFHSSFQVATVHDAQNDDLAGVRPKEGAEITSLDLPDIRAAQFLYLPKGPRGRLEQFEILEDLERIAFFQFLKVPLGPGRINKLSPIHAGVRCDSSWSCGQSHPSSGIRNGRILPL